MLRICKPIIFNSNIFNSVCPNRYDQLVCDITHGYWSPLGGVVPLLDAAAISPAGALKSNVEDMLTFIAANTGPPESRLERSMRDSHELRRNINPQLGVGLNWQLRIHGDQKIVSHSGGTNDPKLRWLNSKASLTHYPSPLLSLLNSVAENLPG